jgi:hypothetical protein
MTDIKTTIVIVDYLAPKRGHIGGDEDDTTDLSELAVVTGQFSRARYLVTWSSLLTDGYINNCHPCFVPSCGGRVHLR